MSYKGNPLITYEKLRVDGRRLITFVGKTGTKY